MLPMVDKAGLQPVTVVTMDGSTGLGLGPAKKEFHLVDYIIFAAVLLISTGIGLYHAFTGGKQKTTNEFFMANRTLRTLPVALSILVSFVSAILVLGTPAEVYTWGTLLTMRTLGYCVACVLSSLLFVPLFFAIKITSTFEYLERRYQSKVVRRLGTVMMLLGQVFYMGLVMFSPSTALQAATGFPLWASIVACGAVSTIYTTLGGMKAVVYTDVFQALIMVAGMLAVVIEGTRRVGGISEVWNLSEAGGRLIFYDFDLDPTKRLTTWSTFFGGMVSTLTIFGIGQASVQRYCAVRTLGEAKRSVFLNIPGLLVMNILATLVGLVIYAYYDKIGCDPLKIKYISNSNQLVPYFIIDVLNYPGFPGVFLAVLFSGALSSMSSGLNSASAVTWEDFLKDLFHKASENTKTLVTKALVLVFGGASIFVAFMADNLGGHVLQASLSFTGATTGPSLGMFLLGALFPCANAIGAGTGCVVSLVFSLWVAIGTYIAKPYRSGKLPTRIDMCPGNHTPFTTASSWTTVPPTARPQLEGLDRLYGLSFLWYSAVGASITVAIGLVVSIITDWKKERRQTQPNLMIPLCDRLCCCLPASILRKLRCGIEDGTPKGDSDGAAVSIDGGEDKGAVSLFSSTTPLKEPLDQVFHKSEQEPHKQNCHDHPQESPDQYNALLVLGSQQTKCDVTKL